MENLKWLRKRDSVENFQFYLCFKMQNCYYLNNKLSLLRK
jgi:hypothetical protein